MATERGKIGRLPDALRGEVNAMIRDNRTAEDIIALLASKGVTDISPQNVSAWKKWGFAKWERRMQRLDEQSARRSWAREMVAQAKADGDDTMTLVSDAASLQAAETIQDVLDELDPSIISGMIAEDPRKFFDMVHALSSLRQRDQAGIKLQMEVETYRREMRRIADEAEKASEATGNDDLKRIAEEMNRVLGAG